MKMVGRDVLGTPKSHFNENLFCDDCGAHHSRDRFAAASPVDTEVAPYRVKPFKKGAFP